MWWNWKAKIPFRLSERHSDAKNISFLSSQLQVLARSTKQVQSTGTRPALWVSQTWYPQRRIGCPELVLLCGSHKLILAHKWEKKREQLLHYLHGSSLAKHSNVTPSDSSCYRFYTRSHANDAHFCYFLRGRKLWMEVVSEMNFWHTSHNQRTVFMIPTIFTYIWKKER